MQTPRRQRCATGAVHAAPGRLLVLLCCLALPGGARADRYVARNGQSPASPFTSWATAASNIQAAVDVADIDDTVWISNGVYTASNGGTIASLSHGLTLRGASGDPADVLLDGRADQGLTNRGVYIGLTAPAVVRVESLTISNCLTPSHGAGLFLAHSGIVSGTAQVHHCILAGNTATGSGRGGGMRTLGAAGSAFVTHLSNTVFAGNRVAAANGGGLYVDNARLLIEACRFERNVADTACDNSGAIRLGTPDAILRDSLFLANTNRGVWGGAMEIQSGILVENCTFTSNEASAGGALFNRTAATAATGPAVFRNCLFTHNQARGVGDGCYLWSNSSNVFENCTFADNAGHAIYNREVTTKLYNTVLYNNSVFDNGTLYAWHSRFDSLDVIDGGAGNGDEDPWFVDRGAGNYRLVKSSPCVNSGTNRVWMADAVDRDGKPRIDSGTVDRGCYEYENIARVNNGAGVSNLLVTSAWLTGSLVSTGDLPTSVFIHWGPSDGGTDAATWSHAIPLGVRGTGTFAAAVAGLATNTTYYYRCQASNDAGIYWAASTTNFVTPPPTLKIDNHAGATAIAARSARLRGELTETFGMATRILIFWGRTDGENDRSQWTNGTNLGIRTSGEFSQLVNGLQTNTTYHYRCAASNAAGLTWAPATTNFTTASYGIVQAGQPLAEIVLPDSPPRMTALAARELQTYIAAMTAATLPIVTNPTPGAVVRIFVGHSPYTEDLGITTAPLDHGAFRMLSGTRWPGARPPHGETHGGWLALVGRDADFHPTEPHNTGTGDLPLTIEEWDALTGETFGFPHGGLYKRRRSATDWWEVDERGSLNAVHDFLRGHGVRWYLPRPLGEIVPAVSSIPLPDVDRTVHPDFALRYPYQAYRNFGHASLGCTEEEVLWQLRLGLHQGAELIGLGPPGHGINHAHSRDEVKAAHPEFYALYNGVRYTEGEGKPCLSSPGLLAQNVKYVRAVFDLYDAPLVSVMPADGYTSACQCDLCAGKETLERGWAGQISDYVWDYVNRVAIEVYKTHPDRKISCFAYGTYRLPPAKIEQLSPNLVVGMAQHRSNFYDEDTFREEVDLREAWRAKLPLGSRQLVIWEYYLHPRPERPTEFWPSFFPHAIARDLKALKGKAMGEFIEVYRDPYESVQRLAMNHLNLYVTSRCWWDADQNVDTLLEEYYTTFYGAASGTMKTFVDYCEANWMTLEDKSDRIETLLGLLTEARSRVASGSLEDQRMALIDAYLQPLHDVYTRLPTNIYWCGNGDGSNWTDVANWTNSGAWWATSARYPRTTNDVAYLSDHGANTAQTLVLDADITLREVRMDATGQRAYTIGDNGNGRRLTVQGPQLDANASSSVQVTLLERAQQPLTLNCDVVRGPNAASLGLHNKNPDHAIVLNGDRHFDSGIGSPNLVTLGTGPIVLGGQSADGPWFFNLLYQSGDLVLANSNAIHASYTQVRHIWREPDTCTWSLRGTDVGGLGRLELKRTARRVWQLRLHEAGDANRTLSMGYLRNWADSAGHVGNWTRFVPNAGGSTGHLTLRLLSAYQNSMPIDFGQQQGTRLLLDGSHTPGTAIYTQERDDIPVTITGAGSVWAANHRTLRLQIATDYTGGTVITNHSAILLETNTVFAGVSACGQLPDRGPVWISDDSVLDLNGRHDTLGSLAGTGRVRLGGATLTTTEGVRPGGSSGTLTFEEEGVLVLGGTSVVHLASAAEFDRLAFSGGADLVLGGVLRVEVSPAFPNYASHRYAIATLNGGTVTGCFAEIAHNLPDGAAGLLIEGNEVLIQFGLGVHATAGVGGDITPPGSVYVEHGGSQRFTVTSRPGYYIDDVRVDGMSIGDFGRGVHEAAYEFTNVTNDRTLTATFHLYRGTLFKLR